MRVFIFIFFLITSLFGEQEASNPFHMSHESSFVQTDTNNSHEQNLHEENVTIQQKEEIQPTQTNDENEQQTILLSYKNFPKNVFVGEIFEIEVEAIIAQSNFTAFKTEFTGGNDVEVLNPHSDWKWYSDNIFYNTFYLKCNNTLANLPDIEFSIIQDNNQSITKTVEGKDIEILPLPENETFSNVLAKSLEIKNSSVSYYDDATNIVVLEIETEYGNLLDFKIKNVIREGIESSNVNFPDAQIYYFAIIPKDRKKFSFTYFNLETNNYEEIFVPIIIDNQNVSTQTDINPKKNRFELYKSIFIIVIAVLFLILSIFRKKKIYLLISIIIAIYVTFFRATFNEVVIMSNTNVKILPTQNSTTFFTTTKATFAEKLYENDNYIKIMLPNSQIGWIKKDRIEKN